MRREEAERMARIEHQRLMVAHLRQVAHRQRILCPIREHRAIASICEHKRGRRVTHRNGIEGEERATHR